jgi:hypothetical protein
MTQIPTKQNALELLRYRDGSCRDVTFTPVTRDAVASFFTLETRRSQLESAFDGDGVDVGEALATSSPRDLLSKPTSSIHSVFKSTDLPVNQFQVFVYWGPGQLDYFVEITFFPQDVVATELDQILELLQEWNGILRADDYFVRFENASWKEYSHTDDVIFTRKRPPR